LRVSDLSTNYLKLPDSTTQTSGASGSPFDISEEMSRRRMEREGVVLTATNTLMAELAQDWSRPEGSQLLQVLFQDVLPQIGVPN
jgi:hypothetical protein